VDGRAHDAPAGDPGVTTDLAPGVTVGGRYQVRGRAWETGPGAVWLAFDTVLERPVLIQTFPSADPAAVGRAVAKAAHVTHPGVSQIYDVTVDPPGIVFENAPAGRLADRTDGALPPPAAAKITCQIAAAIKALHDHGIPHGSIGPSTIVFDEEGRPKLAPASAAEDLGSPASPDAYRPATGDDLERDRYALGAVAYRLFTGREPSPDAPPARAAKRSVPPVVDALLSRALAREAAMRPTLEEFQHALGPIASAEPAERGPGFLRQEASWLVPVLLVVALAITAIFFGVRKVIGPSGGSKSTAQPTATASAYTVSSVTDFDPPPKGNGEEHHGQVNRVIDGTAAAWSTFGYKTAALGGQKPGVGLLFDLGTARPVGRIEITTPDPGWSAGWRTADSPGSAADDFTTQKTFTASGSTITFSPPVTARYWLLWITRLVDSGSGGSFPYQAQVSEVTFFAR
jgi:hypothetical protein